MGRTQMQRKKELSIKTLQNERDEVGEDVIVMGDLKKVLESGHRRIFGEIWRNNNKNKYRRQLRDSKYKFEHTRIEEIMNQIIF